jgi:hypothetical protein
MIDANRKTKQKPSPRSSDGEGFDVVCTIGRVSFDANGDEPAHVVAFKLIAEHDAEGTFTFPMRGGGICNVNVEYH